MIHFIAVHYYSGCMNVSKHREIRYEMQTNDLNSKHSEIKGKKGSPETTENCDSGTIHASQWLTSTYQSSGQVSGCGLAQTLIWLKMPVVSRGSSWRPGILWAI